VDAVPHELVLNTPRRHLPLYGRSIDAQALDDAEALVEDHDDDRVVVAVTDGTQIARAGAAQRFDLDALAVGQPYVPAPLAEAAALASVMLSDDRLGDVPDRIVVRSAIPRAVHA
jgi:hypothetical protein